MKPHRFGFAALVLTLLGCAGGLPGQVSADGASPTPTGSGKPSASASTGRMPILTNSLPPIIRNSLPPTLTNSLPPIKTPAPSASRAPGTSSPAPSPLASGAKVTSLKVYGTVFSTEDLELYLSKVSIQSVDPSKPYYDSTTARDGRYSFTSVPRSTQLRIVANLNGYDVRSILYKTGDGSQMEEGPIDFKGPYGLPKLTNG